MSRLSGWLPACCVALCLSAGAGAQPEPAPSAPPAAERTEDPGLARVRAFMERRLEVARAQAERLEDALQRLNEGVDVGTVRNEFRELFDDREDRGEKPEIEHRDGPGGDDRRSKRDAIDREEFLEFLESEFPRMHERVTQHIQNTGPDDPAAGDPSDWPRARPFIELMRLRDRDPEMYSLRKELWSHDWDSRDLARRAAAAAEPDRAALVEQLRATLEKQFDLQLELHRVELTRLEERLAAARREADERAAARETTVSDRLVEMLTPRETGDRPGPRHDKEPGRPTPGDRAP